MSLEDSLQASHIGVCVKDFDKKVLMQNDCCRSVCGDRQGETCQVGCMEYYTNDDHQQWKEWGTRVYQNCHIHDGFYDVTLLCSAESIVTFLQPLKERYEMALAYYQRKGLTKRETEVIDLTIRGVSNTDICHNLSISKATLRTHLNNIYKKFRDAGETPEFIPANRTLSY
jgi:DNA-binding CsgD family transcriptional regulator